MALTKEQKQKAVEKIKENLGKQKILLFVGISGLKAQNLFDLRNKLKESNCLLTVVKKTLLNIAFKEKKISIDPKNLGREIALVSGFEDEISAAKVSNQFSKTNEKLEILGGFFENQFIDKEKVIALANIPSRGELLSKFIGTIQAPVSGFANVLAGNMRNLVYILSNIKK